MLLLQRHETWRSLIAKVRTVVQTNSPQTAKMVNCGALALGARPLVLFVAKAIPLLVVSRLLRNLLPTWGFVLVFVIKIDGAWALLLR
jgi:hypothetical protein